MTLPDDSDPLPPKPRRPGVVESLRTPSLVNVTVAVLFAVFAAAAAAAFTMSQQPFFQSQATVLIDHPDVATVPNVGPILRLNALRSTYAALVPTEQIAIPVAEELGVDPGFVVANVDVGINADSLVMYPTARAGGRREARVLAEQLTERLVEYVAEEQRTSGIAAADRVRLIIVDPPRPGFQIEPTSTDAVSSAALAGAVGMTLGYATLQLATAPRRARRGDL